MRVEDDGNRDFGEIQAMLSNAVSFVANEAIVLAQYELACEGKFRQLWLNEDSESFNDRVNRVIEYIGGPPEYFLLRTGEKAPPADNYPEASMSEVFAVFSRARQSVIRAHLFMLGSNLLHEQPDLLDDPENPDRIDRVTQETQNAFWEHAEAAYIRLSSYWDRVGQVLDFAFFNIRQFDQNGFSSVMDRIRVNAVPMDPQLENSGSWKRLRDFQSKEQEQDLKFLLRRRNLGPVDKVGSQII